MRYLTIGQVAKQINISNDTIRIYERSGLIEEPARAANGFRQYSNEVVPRLHFIKRAKLMGFTLKEIKELLDLHDAPNSCHKVQDQARLKLTLVQEKIQELKRLEKTLNASIKQCQQQTSNEMCNFFNVLEVQIVKEKQ